MTPELYKKRFFDGVNFDYILAVRYNDDEIEKCTIPIHKDEKTIDEIYRMVDNDEYDVDDIESLFRRRYSNHGDYDYCLGFSRLTDYYIDAICYPKYDTLKYWRKAQNYKDRIKKAKNETVQKRIQLEFNKWNRAEKKEYINQCLPYVFASNYHDAVVRNGIDKDYFIYSDETHGRFSYARKITEDIDIEIKTNFCYGSSSSLAVIITYKGIPILPYSIWVNYYYARYNEVIRCTRSYEPNRSNWDTCMDFVVWFVKKAIENPESFVKDTIMQEVDGLVQGVEELFRLTDEEMERRLSTSIPDVFHDKYYIGIKTARMAADADIRYYKISPKEAKLVYRMEKITGALHFLKSLKQLSEIYDGIDVSINKIKEINLLLYPEIVEAIPPVRKYLSELNGTLEPLEKRLSFVQKKFDYLDDRLNMRIGKANITKEKEEIKASFIKHNPKYTEYKDKINVLSYQIMDLRYKIANRNQYLERLEEAQHLVNKHARVLKIMKE